MTKRIGVAAVFLVGCAVGGASSQLVVPKASAQQAALTKWEYVCPRMPSSDWPTTANKFGAEGWELSTLALDVPTQSSLACFKRPKL